MRRTAGSKRTQVCLDKWLCIECLDHTDITNNTKDNTELQN